MITPRDIQRFEAEPKKASAGTPDRRVAVLVTHGMGQQVPYETLDNFCDGVNAANARFRQANGLPPPPAARARNVILGQQRLQRVELDLETPAGSVELHAYEMYWAPLTEGKVKLKDVTAFLLRGVRQGLLNSMSRFPRYLFGEFTMFPRHWATTIALLVALVVLGDLALLNVIMARITVAKLKSQPSHLAAGLSTVGVFVSAYLVFTLGLFWAAIATKRQARGVLYRMLRISLLVICPLGVLGAFALPPAIWYALAHSSHAGEISLGKFLVSWGVLIMATAMVRWFLIQFVGDVTAYVDAQVLDRFCALRAAIKNAARAIANELYGQRAGDRWLYDQVAHVGHSLGSVIAYDTLNRAISDDQAGAMGYSVVDRTRLLLTTGSPLDKVTYLFYLHGKRSGSTREQLAATVQPMIDDAGVRRFPWINIHSRFDVVSGHLDYFDSAALPLQPFRVVNMVDPEARTPLAAHQEYWLNPCMFDAFLAHI
jgi:hypothetical protein